MEKAEERDFLARMQASAKALDTFKKEVFVSEDAFRSAVRNMRLLHVSYITTRRVNVLAALPVHKTLITFFETLTQPPSEWSERFANLLKDPKIFASFNKVSNTLWNQGFTTSLSERSVSL